MCKEVFFLSLVHLNYETQTRFCGQCCGQIQRMHFVTALKGTHCGASVTLEGVNVRDPV